MELTELKKRKIVNDSQTQMTGAFAAGIMMAYRKIKDEIDDMRVVAPYEMKPCLKFHNKCDCKSVLIGSIDDIRIS